MDPLVTMNHHNERKRGWKYWNCSDAVTQKVAVCVWTKMNTSSLMAKTPKTMADTKSWQIVNWKWIENFRIYPLRFDLSHVTDESSVIVKLYIQQAEKKCYNRKKSLQCLVTINSICFICSQLHRKQRKNWFEMIDFRYKMIKPNYCFDLVNKCYVQWQKSNRQWNCDRFSPPSPPHVDHY